MLIGRAITDFMKHHDGHAFEAVVRDATTGQAGFMQAPVANGFMNTSVSTCDGMPFNFSPSTRRRLPTTSCPGRRWR
jgi:hypothetical protein